MLLLNMMIQLGCEAEDLKNTDTGQSNESSGDDDSTGSESDEEAQDEQDSEPEPSSETGNTDQNPEEDPEEEEEEEEDPEEEEGPLEIIGIYYDQYSTEHSITQARWLINVEGPEEYVYTISQYSNSEGYIIAFNQTTDPNENGFWSRFDYQTSPDILQVCHTTYSAATEEEAFNTPPGALDGNCPGYIYSLNSIN